MFRSFLVVLAAACVSLFVLTNEGSADGVSYTLGSPFNDEDQKRLVVCTSERNLDRLDRAVYRGDSNEINRLFSNQDCYTSGPMKSVLVYRVLAMKDAGDFYQQSQYVEYRCADKPCFGILLQGPLGGWTDLVIEYVQINFGLAFLDWLSQ